MTYDPETETVEAFIRHLKRMTPEQWADCDFGQLGESWKRTAKAAGRTLHGKEGRGRLRFFSLADRIAFLQTLEQAVFDPTWKKTLRERGGLDALVRDNTWIFGEEFHIAMHEVGLTRVMERVAADQGIKSTGKVTQGDGRSARLDEFLGRSIPGAQAQKHEYLVVELKRPSVRGDRKVLNQITDYALALASQPDFAHTDTTWTFFLVVGEYDDVVRQSITQDGRDLGIAVKHPNYTVWVKCWSEIIRDCKARLQYIQNRLQVQVSDDEINTRLRQLQSSFGQSPDNVQD